MLLFAFILVAVSVLVVSGTQIVFAQEDTVEEFYNSAFVDYLVNGTYVNEELGLEMEFPERWLGFDFTDFPGNKTIIHLHVVASPLFANFSSADKGNFVLMMLVSGHIDDILAADYSADEYEECDEPEVARIVRAGADDGMKAVEAVVECNLKLLEEYVPEGYELTIKLKTYIFLTQDGEVIYVAYAATSDETYEDRLSEFEKSVESLRIENAADISDLAGYASEAGFHASNHEITAEGKQYELKVISNSTGITNFAFDGQAKQISFRVDGPEGTLGSTSVEVGTVLEGPYTVLLDNRLVENDNIIVISDETTNRTTIRIYHPHSVHEVVVTGTNVVPEFPAPLVGVTAFIGLIAALSRRMFSAISTKS